MNTNDKLIKDFIHHIMMLPTLEEKINFLRVLPEEDMIKPVAFALKNKGIKFLSTAEKYGIKEQVIYYRMRKIYTEIGKEFDEEEEEKEKEIIKN